MKTDTLRAFYVLSQTLNYRKAADKLYISQSAITRQIASLEKEWGFPLFIRTTRSVRLTKRGQLLLRDVKQFLDSVDQLSDHVRTLSSDTPVTIGYFGTPNLPFVSVIFNEWSIRYPDCPLSIITDSLDRMVKKLEDGEIDCLISLRPSIARLGRIGFKRLERQNPAVILPVDHALAKQESIPIDKLKLCGPVLLPIGPNRFADRALADFCRENGIEVSASVKDETLAFHVSCGEGLGLKPVFLNDYRSNLCGTMQLPLKEDSGVFDRVLAYSYENDNHMFKKCLEVVDYCINNQLFPVNYC